MKSKYPQAVWYVAIWYSLCTFNLNIGVFDLLPDWLGYIFLCCAIDGLAEYQPTASLLKPVAYLLTAIIMILRITDIMGIFPDAYIFTAITSIMYLYVHYQVCTNIYDTVLHMGTESGQSIALHRDITTVTYTALMLTQSFMQSSPVFIGVMIIHIISKAALMFALYGHSSRRKKVTEGL